MVVISLLYTALHKDWGISKLGILSICVWERVRECVCVCARARARVSASERERDIFGERTCVRCRERVRLSSSCTCAGAVQVQVQVQLCVWVRMCFRARVCETHKYDDNQLSQRRVCLRGSFSWAFLSAT